MTIGEALKHGDGRLNTERLLLHVLNKTESSWLYAHSNDLLSETAKQPFLAALQLRQTGLPLAYILGFTEFYGRTFIVTPDVLIPRPETEELVSQALEAIKIMHAQLQRPLTIADIGTGSGCIAITLALEAPDMLETIYATDISEKALAVAEKNIARYFAPPYEGGEPLQAGGGLIFFKHGDLLAGINPVEIDLIISNPPYVPTKEIDAAYSSPTPDTIGLKFEPSQALDGGQDGQDIITRLLHLNRPTILETTGGLIQKFNF